MFVTGRLVWALLLGLVPVVLLPSLGTVWLWVAVVTIAAGFDWWRAPKPDDLVIERDRLGATRLGEPSSTSLLVRNPGAKRMHGLLRDAWQPTAGAIRNRHPISLAPGTAVRISTPLLPRRRGDLRSPGVAVRSLGPLGIAGRQRLLAVTGQLRSLPAFGSRKHLPSRLARLRELDGRAAVRTRGQGTEFDSLREYVRGDDIRSIDWRASARTRSVVVRTWQPERDRRVILVLDTSRTSAGRIEDVPRLDSAMDAALLLGSLAARAGDRVDFLAGDRLVRSRLRLRSSKDIAGRLSEAMADLEPVIAEADWRSLAAGVAGLGRQRALLVLLTPLEPAAIEESLLPVLPSLLAHHRVVLASVRDPELTRLAARRADAAEVFTAAAAEQTMSRRAQTERMLRALGVTVVDADAETLPPKLADHYLFLKAEGLL